MISIAKIEGLLSTFRRPESRQHVVSTGYKQVSEGFNGLKPLTLEHGYLEP